MLSGMPGRFDIRTDRFPVCKSTVKIRNRAVSTKRALRFESLSLVISSMPFGNRSPSSIRMGPSSNRFGSSLKSLPSSLDSMARYTTSLRFHRVEESVKYMMSSGPMATSLRNLGEKVSKTNYLNGMPPNELVSVLISPFRSMAVQVRWK